MLSFCNFVRQTGCVWVESPFLIHFLPRPLQTTSLMVDKAALQVEVSQLKDKAASVEKLEKSVTAKEAKVNLIPMFFCFVFYIYCSIDWDEMVGLPFSEMILGFDECIVTDVR